jgi:orotidine-5'-phosphate decarboxylase
MEVRTKLIVALDVTNYTEAELLVEELHPYVDVFKVGSILYTLEGKKVIDLIRAKGKKVFLDLKFFDIPNTVKEVSFVTSELGVDMFTIHLLGGKEMIRATLGGIMDYCSHFHSDRTPLVLGVTVLTSMNDEILRKDLQIGHPVKDMVRHLARMGYDEGVRGFVCSPFEIEILRQELGKDIILVTPGVRLSGDSLGDQKRVMTPAKAKELGANYIVMGRSVLEKPNRVETVKQILEEIK